MMKKKVKKIPKYSGGIAAAGQKPNLTITKNPAGDAYKMQQMKNFSNNASSTPASMGNIASLSNDMLMNTFNIEDNSTAGVMLNSTAQGADIGGSIVPGWGHLIGGAAGAIMGSLKSGSVDENTGEIQYGGIFGHSKEYLRRKSNQIKNSIQSRTQTQNLQSDYYNENPTGSINVLAAEGGIMRKPVDALVSKGELIYNPVTKKLSQVPGSKGKPNKADDVYTRLYEGDVVISNSPTMLMSNGKTPAQNLMGMVDKYSTGGTVKAREAIIKKVVNWQEANKTKPQEYAKFYGGGIAGINKYRYNKNMSDFAYWDKDKNEYKKEYLDWVNNLTEQDVRDIEAGKYGDMTEYFSKNKGKKLDVATAQKLMTDKKYGNWHKIGRAVVDNKIKTKGPALDNVPHMAKQINIFPGMKERVVHHVAGDGNDKAELTHLYTQGLEIPKLKKLPNPSEADGIIAAYKAQNKGKGTPDWLSNIVDFAPVAAALFGDYDYHTEQAQMSPAKYIPTGVSIDPIRRAANESYAMARYNQANINPNTGAGMAYGLQAASNRAKTLADAYAWQQDAQNKLIAQNAGIYNDWAKRYDAARYQAIADTRANEGAAQQMRDSAIRDAYEFMAGRRNDRMRLAMMEPLAKYAFDDDTYKKIYSRAIV